jgi:hypothetical protein
MKLELTKHLREPDEQEGCGTKPVLAYRSPRSEGAQADKLYGVYDENE